MQAFVRAQSLLVVARPLVMACVLAASAPRRALGTDTTTDGAAEREIDPAVLRALSATDWIYEAESVQIKATLVIALSQDTIDVRRASRVKEYPGMTDADLAKVPSLMAESTSQFTWAWDRRRAAFHGEHPGWLQQDVVWDGVKGINHLDWKIPADNSHALRLAVPGNITRDYFGWLPWAWLGNATPLQTESVVVAGGRQSHDKSRDEFRGLSLHREVMFDGVPCDMYWEPEVGNWNCIDIERSSGRIRRKRLGSRGIEHKRLWLPILTRHLRERGFEATEANAESVEKQLSPEMRQELTESSRAELEEAYRINFELLDPIWTATFSDWREVKPGRFFPFKQVTVETSLAAEKTLADAETRTVTIDSLTVDETLPDSLFQVPIVEGARVYDESLGFPVSYTQDKNRSKEEWQQLLDRARASHEETVQKQQSLDDLIGTQATEFPSSVWLNSEPMTWKKLQGQYVILDFWHVGCGPCRDAAAWMQAIHKNQEEGLSVVGVHGSGVTADDLKAAAQEAFKISPSFPIVLDIGVDEHQAREGAYPSVLFQAYRVGRMPYTWLIGPDGTLIAHGDIEEMVNEARRRIRMK